MKDFKSIIRDVPDFPKKGIIFKDLTTLFKDSQAFRELIDIFTERYKYAGIKSIASAEARGFIIGAPLAYNIGANFIPIRKKGKLPHKTIEISYELEYGSDTLCIHEDAISKDDNVLIVDDLLATGGTSLAIAKLIEKCGANIHELAFLVELEFLNARKLLKKYNVFSIIQY